MVQLIKLGGSVLTDKAASAPTLRKDVLARLARELAGADEELVIVHGAGSFGHPLAKAAGLKHGLSADGAVAALAQVHADVRRLNVAVLDALRGEGLAPTTFSPFALFTCSDGRPGGWNFVPMHRALSMGLTPVTHGDVVFDTNRGTTVVSGDQLVAEMVGLSQPTRVVFVLDQDGVLSGPPGADDSELLHRPGPDAVEEAIRRVDTTGAPDVTGGMAGKLAAASHIARRQVPVFFVNGLVEGRVADVLAGKDVGEGEGTVLAWEEAV